ncbi:MAG: hypothetical protein ACK4M8_02135 [Allorhizobium sp.]
MSYQVDPYDGSPKACFRRVLNLIDALPERFKPSDETPLREAMPGGWPTIGEFRSFMNPIESPPPSSLASRKPGDPTAEELQIIDMLRIGAVKVVAADWTEDTPPPQTHVDHDRLIGSLLDRWEMTPNDLKEEMREHGCGKQLDALMQNPAPQPREAVR